MYIFTIYECPHRFIQIHLLAHPYIYSMLIGIHTHKDILALTCIYISWLIVIKRDLKAPFSIGTTSRCSSYHNSFPWIGPLTLDPYLIMLSVLQGGLQVPFFESLVWQPGIEFLIYWTIGEHSLYQWTICRYIITSWYVHPGTEELTMSYLYIGSKCCSQVFLLKIRV